MPTRSTVRLAPRVSGGPACCPTGLTQPLQRTDAAGLAGLFKALSDPARLQLLALIAASPDGEACACDLTSPLGLSQPTVSHHLKILTEAGIITRASRGTWAWFAVAPERVAELEAVLAGLLQSLPRQIDASRDAGSPDQTTPSTTPQPTPHDMEAPE